MSEQNSETSSADEQGSNEGLEGLQESHLDSVTGGGNVPEPLMDLQDAEPDTFEKSAGPGDYETEESRGDQPQTGGTGDD